MEELGDARKPRKKVFVQLYAKARKNIRRLTGILKINFD